jgi:hypothetical protein
VFDQYALISSARRIKPKADNRARFRQRRQTDGAGHLSKRKYLRVVLKVGVNRKSDRHDPAGWRGVLR